MRRRASWIALEIDDEEAVPVEGEVGEGESPSSLSESCAAAFFSPFSPESGASISLNRCAGALGAGCTSRRKPMTAGRCSSCSTTTANLVLRRPSPNAPAPPVSALSCAGGTAARPRRMRSALMRYHDG